MKLDAHLPLYAGMIDGYLDSMGISRLDIDTGQQAWTLAHRSGVTSHAYGLSRDVLDAHIQTALSRLMPNAVFKDAKRY